MFFTDQPLALQTLTKRLAKYGFWHRHKLDPAVACNAIEAAKTVASKSQFMKLPLEAEGVLRPKPNHKPRTGDELLTKICTHPPVLRLFNAVWRELLFLSPRPSYDASIKLLSLQNNCSEEYQKALHGLVRTELGRGNYVGCVDLISLAPAEPISGVLRLPLATISIGLGSSLVWLSSPPIAVLLCTFWTILGVRSAVPAKYPRVEWTPGTNVITRITGSKKLRFANQIVTGFEELAVVNLSNYHLRAHEPIAASKQIDCELDNALAQHCIQRRGEPDAELYADYWSSSHTRWNNVEWQEPDQDPSQYQHKD